jgi:transposase
MVDSGDQYKKASTVGQLEGNTGVSGRRRWTIEQKMAIVAETYSSSISVAAVALRHGINRNQLDYWRRQFGSGAASGATGGFVPVMAAPTVPDMSAVTAGSALRDTVGGAPTVIEVVVGTMVVRVSTVSDEGALRRVLGVVRSLA